MSGRSSSVARLDWATRHQLQQQECSGCARLPLLSFVGTPSAAAAPRSSARRLRHTPPPHQWKDMNHCSFQHHPLDRTKTTRNKAITAGGPRNWISSYCSDLPTTSATELRMVLPTTTADSLTVAAADAMNVVQQPQQPQPIFEPVLNVPAFSVFVLVALLFAGLQWRVAAIGRAAEERTQALEELRRAKSRQLSQGGNAVDCDEAQVRQALKAYERAYWKVEKLRTVIPGVARLVPPPSQSLNRQIMEENEAAARQFLGIETAEAKDDEPVSSDEEKQQQLSPVLTAVLAVIAVSQIALLVLFVATDPMLVGGGFGGGGGASLLDGVVDAVSGME